ncbi:hypothetical protein [Cupriavidus sp. H18C2]|uniref:hypothetical protein n=1 Tax=Cupriavidus sp. H18C2 TaxID=3241602 RepID=UPI003BF7A6CF
MIECNVVPTDIGAIGGKINTVSCMLGILLWAAEKCENSHDFEQFHCLALDLGPRIGATLDRAVKEAGLSHTGLFDTTEVHHD